MSFFAELQPNRPDRDAGDILALSIQIYRVSIGDLFVEYWPK
jgi:hypothetical protein